jgi:M6 family metalloprotease-like protein
VGPYTLPEPLASYRVKPYNFEVDSQKVYHLAKDGLSLAEKNGAKLAEVDVVALILRAYTEPGKGYGMICYCANPGMLSKVNRGRAKYDPITTAQGTVYQKGLVVMTENFHLGFIVHDLAHALGGVQDGERLVGDLYDFDLQSRHRAAFEITDTTVHLGPWDIMSQHYIQRTTPPAGFSIYTKIRMGYLKPDQVLLVKPGQTNLARLAPLATGGPMLGVKLPLGQKRYLLLENRQPVNLDQQLPSSGIMVYEVDEGLEEGKGRVKAKASDSSAANFSRAPFGHQPDKVDLYLDEKANLAVAPLVKLDQDYLVLLTSAKEAGSARDLARNIRSRQGSPGFGEKLRRISQHLRQGELAPALALAKE